MQIADSNVVYEDLLKVDVWNELDGLVNVMHGKYYLSSLVGCTGQHFVRPPSFFEREHGTHFCAELLAIEQFRERAKPARGDVDQKESGTKARKLWGRRN